MDDFEKLFPNDIDVFPANTVLPSTDWHVCRTHVVLNGPNYEGICFQCGVKVYFQDNFPAIQKIRKLCVHCFEKIPEDKRFSYGNAESRLAAILRRANN